MPFDPLTHIGSIERPDLAPYALRSARSRGRRHPENFTDDRPAFDRDRDRVIHSSSFRRLEYKTQVFVNHEGDYYRTRLTHSLETAQIARSIARRLRLNEEMVEALGSKRLLYDKTGEEHFNTISAFIKSLRGSDPDAAVYWLARMLEAGEDPKFIVRRMIILASEDVGNADPKALQIAVAAATALQYVGLPEAALNLAHAAIYLASTPKSNASYMALKRAKAV